MERNTIMAPTLTTPDMNAPAGRLKGRAIGALVCGGFGALWMFQAVYWGGIATPAWISLAALLTAVFILWPATLLWSLRRSPYGAGGSQSWSAVAPKYWTIVIIEWLTLSIAVNWLNRIGHGDLTPQVVGIVVGLHFWPLAKLFKAHIYYWTGAVMLLGVLASLLIPAGSVRNLVAYGMGGYSLWATAAVILCQDTMARRSSAV